MKKHLGSTIALLFGVLVFIAGATKPNSLLIAGLIIILGALAYRSAKKRKLGEVEPSKLRQVLEIVAMILIVASILLQNDIGTRMINDPVPNLVIPLCALVAYVIIACRK